MRTTLRATGPLAADEAWERYADLDRWPEWAPQITGVTVDGPADRSAPRRLRPGLRGTVRAAGVMRVRFEVLTVDERARTWSWRVRFGPIVLGLEHGIEDVDGPAEPRDADAGRTRTWLRVTGPTPVVLAYAPVALVALHALLLAR